MSQSKLNTFDKEAAIAAVLYISSKVKDPTLHRIFKILYFADKEHLEGYGRFIAGDNYVAMRHGPVPSVIYDMLKTVRGSPNFYITQELVEEFKRYFEVEGHQIKALAEPDLDSLSDSDVECLDKSIKVYGDKTFGELTELSHDDAWKSTDENDSMSIEQIAGTLKNASEVLEYLRDPYPG